MYDMTNEYGPNIRGCYPCWWRNKIINALSFVPPPPNHHHHQKQKRKRERKKKEIYVKQLCGCRLLSRGAEWEGEEDGEHLGMELRGRQESLSSAQAAMEGERERESCLHSLHTLSNSYYRLSAAFTHSHSDAGLLYYRKKIPCARKVRTVHIEKTIVLIIQPLVPVLELDWSTSATRVLITVSFHYLYHYSHLFAHSRHAAYFSVTRLRCYASMCSLWIETFIQQIRSNTLIHSGSK